jgi:hypothetical protein
VHWMPRERLPGHWIPIRIRFGLPGEPHAGADDSAVSNSQLLRSSSQFQQRGS